MHQEEIEEKTREPEQVDQMKTESRSVSPDSDDSTNDYSCSEDHLTPRTAQPVSLLRLEAMMEAQEKG
jgi:hypothetical protein